MRRALCLVLAGGCLIWGLPAESAEPGPQPEQTALAARTCLADLASFARVRARDGYWLSESSNSFGYGYGYPLGDYPATVSGMHAARPGHEVRLLVASATILAHHGKQQECEAVLRNARDLYQGYIAGLRRSGALAVDPDKWRQEQITAARPVTDNDAWFRSDALIGTEVRNPQNQPLGSVSDEVLTPDSGKIAYLVINPDADFGFDGRYVPVPWGDFRLTPTGALLVLNATKGLLTSAPSGTEPQFATPTTFDMRAQKVDAYWAQTIQSGGGISTGH